MDFLLFKNRCVFGFFFTGVSNERRELMRSNSERDRHITNHHTSTVSLRKAMYRDPYDNSQNCNGIKGLSINSSLNNKIKKRILVTNF